MSGHDEDAVVARIKSNKAFAKGPVRSILSQLKPGDRLPGGLVCVPAEPTPELLLAGWPHFSALGDKPNGYGDFAEKRYRDLLAAASGD